MDKKKTAYIYLPVVVLTVLIAMYFSGIKWAQEVICPSVDWELGLVENLQLLLLLMIFGVSLIAVFRKELKLEKVAFLLLALFALFVFLEEIDYGNHFLKYFEGKEDTIFSDLTGHANIHNEGNNAKLFKRSIYPLMGILFILAPLIKERINNRFLAYLIPDRYIMATAIITIFSYLVPRLLVDLNILKDGGFGVNIGEFSEIMIYYIFFLYLYEIIFRKTYIK
jgi:hypothetical protein